jgi:hypothetical protein
MSGFRGPRGLVIVGELCVVAALVRICVGASLDESSGVVSSIAGLALVLGGPLSVPWVIVWLINLQAPSRELTVLERLFYGLVLLCEVALFVVWPTWLLTSEGFGLLLVWGLTIPVGVVTVLLSLEGSARAERKSEEEGRG